MEADTRSFLLALTDAYVHLAVVLELRGIYELESHAKNLDDLASQAASEQVRALFLSALAARLREAAKVQAGSSLHLVPKPTDE